MLKTLHHTTVFSLLLCAPALSENAQISNNEEPLAKQVEALMKRINELESNTRRLNGITEKEALTTGSKVNVKLRAHVNRAVLWHSNGKNSNIVHVDNGASSSRLSLTAIGALAEKTKIGSKLEVELKSNSSGKVNVHDANDSTSTFKRRKAELFIKDKRLGELFIGHGGMASYSTMENPDLSNTGVLSSGATVGDTAGGTKFYNRTTGKAGYVDSQPLKVSTVFESGDGLYRQDRIRYNSPNFYGFSLQSSHYYKGHNDNWDVALKYSGSLGGTKISAETAYMHHKSPTTTVTAGTVPMKYKQFNASAGILFANGISLFTGIVNRDWYLKGAPKGTVYHGKIGYQKDFFEAGKTAFAIDFGQYTAMVFDTRSGFEADKYKGKAYGAFAVQFLDRIGTELYLGARLYQFKGPSKRTARYRDVKAIMLGSRIKF